MLTNIRWQSLPVLVGETKVRGVRIATITQLKHAKEALHLSEQSIIDLPILISLNIFRLDFNSLEQLVAELRHHEQLLQHRYHVADVAKVLDARILMFLTALTGAWIMKPGLRPGEGLNHAPEVFLEEDCHLTRFERLDERVQKFVGLCARFVGLAFVLNGALRHARHEVQILEEELLKHLVLLA